MEKENENKVDTEELKSETTEAVNQVKDTIKKVDIKKDSIETKGFVTEMFKNPLGKIQEIVSKNDGKFLKYAIIILVIWVVARLIARCANIISSWGYINMGRSLWGIIAAIISPIATVLVMSVIIFMMNSKNKKSLTTVITAVTSANIPMVIASIVSLLTILSSSVSIITSPFSQVCSIASILLMYFAAKAIFGTEKNSEFIKKFIIIEVIYYIVYIVLGLLNIYI